MSTQPGLPNTFDPVYFQDSPWSDRVDDWVEAANQFDFATGNRHVVQKAMADDESGLRVVINIGTRAILGLLPKGRYLNLYERPEIGGSRKAVSEERKRVDSSLGLDGQHVYFGAVALGGVGVRFYGEYCMVLNSRTSTTILSCSTAKLDDILLEPIGDLDDPANCY